ncbi:peptidase T [Lactobacillus sp. CC-MHH1034]|uniref:peptidase T n=1 Tax=Agrilactobacillus fermenti TaxID=2586909 RepID=UPI001E572CCB|nr:peptidase T [Agrilactobacillus fermenti]MCD2257413.1 peptidase T [Agrilactobacillus fermenti]
MNYRIDTQQLYTDFKQYVQIDTESNDQVAIDTVPSTPGQTELAKVLVHQLTTLGLREVKLNANNGFVTALLPATDSAPIATIGFIAHLDTAPDFTGHQVSPQVHPNYDGQPIHFKNGLVLAPDQFPNLKHYLGQTLITSDGTTLLGVDDKAGIAAIVNALRFLVAHPELKHGPVKVAFGPDEEIGRGADRFDVADFNAKFAYTLDNGLVGEIEYETFNAAQAIINITGTSVHPGEAKGKLVNAITIAEQIDQALPANDRPEYAEGHQGFYLLHHFEGNVDHAQLTYIIRDFDKIAFETRKQRLKNIVTHLNEAFPEPRIKLKLTDQYYNMADIINQDPYPIELAKQALKNLHIQPFIRPFRGGTDGSKLTYLGLPTPNLFNGGENFHGPYEFVTLEAMSQTVATVLEIIAVHDKSVDN